MDLNPNRYSGQPTFSRDVTGLMRRINALEARANLEPAGSSFRIYDIDVWNGRVYALVLRNFGLIGSDPLEWRFQVYDATTGAFLDSFAPPEGLLLNDDAPLFRTSLAMPSFCVGDGYIFMPGAPLLQTTEAAANGYPERSGIMYRFSTNGDSLESVAFDGFDTVRDAAPSPAYTQPYGPTYGYSYSNYNMYGAAPKIHFHGGYVYGVYSFGRWNKNDDLVTYTIYPYMMTRQCNSLCIVKSDFSKAWTKLDAAEPYTGPRFFSGSGDPWYSIAPVVHRYSLGGIVAYDGKLYFDAGGEVPEPPLTAPTSHLPAPYWGSIDLNDDDIAHPNRVRDSVDSFFSFIFIGNYASNQAISLPSMYLTNGISLYHDHLDYSAGSGYQLKIIKRDFASGSYITEYTGYGFARLRDGLLWTLQSGVLQSRDPDTFALNVAFLIGDGRKQTEWFGIPTSGTRASLGTPDGGVSVPADDALTSYAKTADHVIQCRTALEEIADSFRSPTGDAYNIGDTEDDANLYVLAMGDRTKYGATGGARVTWTRSYSEMTFTSIVNVPGDYSYVCIKDHLSSANNKPGVGGQWRTYWREWTDSDIGPMTEWAENTAYGLHKTYDIDIGEIDECVTVLEGSELTSSGV